MKLPSRVRRASTRSIWPCVWASTTLSTESASHWCTLFGACVPGTQKMSLPSEFTVADSVVGWNPTTPELATFQISRSMPVIGHGRSSVSRQTGLGRPFRLRTLSWKGGRSQVIRIPRESSCGSTSESFWSSRPLMSRTLWMWMPGSTPPVPRHRMSIASWTVRAPPRLAQAAGSYETSEAAMAVSGGKRSRQSIGLANEPPAKSTTASRQ